MKHTFVVVKLIQSQKLPLRRDASRNRAKKKEDLMPSKVCKTSLIQLSMPCIHERILSTVGEVGLEVIPHLIFGQCQSVRPSVCNHVKSQNQTQMYVNHVDTMSKFT